MSEMPFEPMVVTWWPNRIERSLAAHWPLLLGAPVALWECVAIADGHVVEPANQLTTFAWLCLPVIVALGLSAICLEMCQYRFASVLPYLASSGSLQPRKGHIAEQVLRAQRDFNDRLASRLRYFVIAAALPFAAIPAISIHLVIGSSTMAHSAVGGVLLVSTIVAFVAWCYGVGAVAWTLYCGGWLIRSLPERFRIVIRLGHPDRCGGLRELGLTSFWLSSPVLTGFVVVCTWLLALRHVLFASLMVIIPTTVLLAAMTVVTFLWPLWRVHETLIVQRREYESEYGRLIERALKVLSDCAADPDDERLAAASKRVEIIRQLEPLNVGFPAWPFDTAVVLRLVLPQIGGLLLALASRFVK